ncbi:MAG: chemotaxis protein CheW [bacterium]
MLGENFRKENNGNLSEDEITNNVVGECFLDITVIDFFLGGEWYGLEIKYIQEVIKPPKIFSIPGTPNYLLGAINHRGNIITVMDLASFLKIGLVNLSNESRIIIIRVGELKMGLIVDSVSEIFTIPAKSIEPPLSVLDISKMAYILGEYQRKDKLVILLNLLNLVKTEGIIIDC